MLSPSECSAIELDDQTLESLLPPQPRTLSPYELLPREIQDHIIALAEQSELLTNDNPLLKTLRLVSKTLHNIATPGLFHTVVLYQHLDRWEALNNIARHPELAKHVQRIQLACIHELTTNSYNLEEYEVDYENWQHPHNFASMADHPPDGGPLALLNHVDLDQRYARFRLWNDKEKFVCAGYHERTAPVLDLQLFGPLTIETVGPHELSTVKRKGIDTVTKWAPRQNYCTRRHAETGIAEDGPMLFNGVDICKTWPVHLHLFMYAGMAAGANITSLTLRHVEELMRGVGIELPNLRHLKLDFAIRDPGFYYCPAHLGVWLLAGKLAKLEEITLIQNAETEDAVDIIAAFDQTHFPSLRRVTLVSPETTGKALGNFIERHWHTLKCLHISTPVMRPSQWTWFWARMRNVKEQNVWRYDGKMFDLAPEAKPLVRDEAFVEEYWNERMRRPQNQKLLCELSMRVKTSLKVES